MSLPFFCVICFKIHLSHPFPTYPTTDSARDYFKTEPDTKDLSRKSPVQFPSTEPDSLQHSTEPCRGSGRESGTPSHLSINTRFKNSCPWQLRLDYLVAIGPPSMPGCYCMVCSEELPVVRVSSFRRHIQDSHPETSNLSQRDREDIASAWTQDAVMEEPETHSMQGKDTNLQNNELNLSILIFYFFQSTDITRWLKWLKKYSRFSNLISIHHICNITMISTVKNFSNFFYTEKRIENSKHPYNRNLRAVIKFHQKIYLFKMQDYIRWIQN